MLDSYCCTPVLSTTQQRHHLGSFPPHYPSLSCHPSMHRHMPEEWRQNSSWDTRTRSFPFLHPNEMPDSQSHRLCVCQLRAFQDDQRTGTTENCPASAATRTYLPGSWLLLGLAARSSELQSTRFHPRLTYNPSTPQS